MKPDEPYKPLLSIIIPMYNVEKYIKFCINSVIKNDISDVEILIVNDGSTDSSRAIMEKYQSEYSQIRVYDKKNEGVSSARNYGLMKSKGDWVWFIDSDDAINQGSLKYIKKEISDRNNKFDILVFKYLKFKRNSDVSKINDIKIPNEAKAISKFSSNIKLHLLLTILKRSCPLSVNTVSPITNEIGGKVSTTQRSHLYVILLCKVHNFC